MYGSGSSTLTIFGSGSWNANNILIQLDSDLDPDEGLFVTYQKFDLILNFFLPTIVFIFLLLRVMKKFFKEDKNMSQASNVERNKKKGHTIIPKFLFLSVFNPVDPNPFKIYRSGSRRANQ